MMKLPIFWNPQRFILLVAACLSWTLGACQTPGGKDQGRRTYDRLRRNVQQSTLQEKSGADTLNFFDRPGGFDPFRDSLPVVLDSMASELERESQSGNAGPRTHAEVIRFNLTQVRKVDTPGQNQAHPVCRQKECRLWARVSKERQRLFLYLDGQVVDSFKVSTGLPGEFETPSFDVRPSGPVFRQYTSRKFPGGNYMGLGNMPYAVFFSGGFAIHGTTQGNIPRLGNKASHGCIRLHPDNARLFFELVQSVGLRNAWVTVE